MFESLWIVLLIVALVHKVSRPLACLLAVKWVVNYTAANMGFWLIPAASDMLFGAVGVMLCLNHPARRTLSASFVIVPLIHAWHWILWANATYVGEPYFYLMQFLFSVQVVSAAWPGGPNAVSRVFDWVVVALRRSLDYLAPAPNIRTRSRRSRR